MAKMEEVAELKRITAEVDWDLEMASVARKVSDQEGPALLFYNIKGHRKYCMS